MMTNKFIETWNSLPEEEKINRLFKIYPILKKAAEKQLLLVNDHEKNENVPKEIFYHYFYVTVKEFWDKMEFLVHLSKGGYGRHNKIVLRSILEQLLQFSYFTSVDTNAKNAIVLKEIIRIYKRLYDRDLKNNRDPSDLIKRYDKHVRTFDEELRVLAIPIKLEDIREANIKSFPAAEILCKVAAIIIPKSDAEKWYDDYKYFSEFIHNGLITQWQVDPEIMYRQNLQYALTYCMHMLKVTDRYYLDYITKNAVINALNEVKYIFCS